MRKRRASMPSPALVISLIALFVALGGSAYAVKKVGTKELKNNAVTAAKIKKSAVTAAKIKKNAVTAAKLKNNAVTGPKIDESTLGAVPNAAHAASADQATNATNATNWSGYTPIGVIKASEGETKVLHTLGPFTIYGRCTDQGASSEAYMFATTSEPKSSFASYEDNYYEADFEPGTEAEINYTISSSSPYTNMYYTYYSQFHLANADGSVRASGDLFSGVNYFGAPCAFWGHITRDS